MTQTSPSSLLESLGSSVACLHFLALDQDEFKAAMSDDEIAAPGVILGPRFLDAVCLGGNIFLKHSGNSLPSTS